MGKAYPILFQGEMVRAILAGTKLQTRRLVNVTSNDGRHTIGDDWRFVSSRDTAMGQRDYEKGEWCWQHQTDIRRVLTERCPFGQVGDRLWVKETWRTAAALNKSSPAAIAEQALDANYPRPWAPIEYVADGERVSWVDSFGEPGKTRVSIHMPRWASRITLEVTSVRVERLQDISEDDALAEGVQLNTCPKHRYATESPYRFEFERLWDSINGKRAPWASNPWLWVVGFKRVEGAL